MFSPKFMRYSKMTRLRATCRQAIVCNFTAVHHARTTCAEAWVRRKSRSCVYKYVIQCEADPQPRKTRVIQRKVKGRMSSHLSQGVTNPFDLTLVICVQTPPHSFAPVSKCLDLWSREVCSVPSSISGSAASTRSRFT